RRGNARQKGEDRIATSENSGHERQFFFSSMHSHASYRKPCAYRSTRPAPTLMRPQHDQLRQPHQRWFYAKPETGQRHVVHSCQIISVLC
ncbi:MAG: hypothetical protein ACRCUE_16390, partial [Bosea sp. (in: a-proteobacteria)]